MGEQVDNIFISFKFTTKQEKNYEEVKEKFENYFIVKRNIIFEWAKFNSRSRCVRESVDSFNTDLYGLARYYNFGALKEENRIVVGLQNRKLLEKLQLDPNLTLEKATNLARQERDSETTTKHSWRKIEVYPCERWWHRKRKIME